MPEKITKFTGVPSFTHDGFCFDVTETDFDRLVRSWQTGNNVRRFHRSCRGRGLFRVYPDDLLPEFDENALYDIEVTVRMKPVGKAEKIGE